MPTLIGYYTISEAADVLKRSESQVSRYIKQGLLPAVDLGHQKVMEQSIVHNFTPPPRGNPNFRRGSEPQPQDG